MQREFMQKLGHSPSPQKIAKKLELETLKIWGYLNILSQVVSLDVQVGDNQDIELQKILEDDSFSPETYTVQKFLRKDLRTIMAKLTLQQREVLSLHLELNDGNEINVLGKSW